MFHIFALNKNINICFKRIKDILDSIGGLNLQVPENLNRLPDNFPDTKSHLPLENNQKIKMSSIYKIWKMICKAWKTE